jgi:molybdenum cofactor biosynthesis enzyme MoaA
MPHGGAPDLLFEDVKRSRVEALGARLETLAVEDGFPLHRVTVFLSYGCNLRCPYCKTIARTPRELARAPQKRGVFSVEHFGHVLDVLGEGPIEHLHLTGGEASLVPGVVDMVREAKRRGVRCVSMTTNGTAGAARYLALVEAGLGELRFSIDAGDAELGAQLTGAASVAWSKSVEALRAVAAARDAGAAVRVLANTVVGRANRVALGGIVRFLLGLGADDVKLITDVDLKAELADFPQLPTVRADLEAVLAGAPRDALPLLRRKVATVFATDAIGLDDAQAAGRALGTWRCFIPLSERTLDTQAYYPCSVYLREGGAPIGRVDESAQVQREASARWVREHDCRADAICRAYCLHCTRGFNDAANAERVRLEQTRAWLERPPPTPAQAQPFLLLTPAGRADSSVEPHLRALGIVPREVATLQDYPRLSMALYARRALTSARLQLRLAYEAAWRARFRDVAATVWLLDEATFAVAWLHKRMLRVRWPAQLLEHGAQTLVLQPFHLPDPEDVPREWAWVAGGLTASPLSEP